MNKFIIIEGHADAVIIKVLGYKQHLLEGSGIGAVINFLQLNNSSLRIGFVDNDKNSKGKREHTEYFPIKSEHHNSLILKQKPKTKSYLIMHTNLEKWLDEMADDLEINKAKYRVSDLRTNDNKYKVQSIKENEDFKNFISALSQKKESPLKTVMMRINELKEKYNIY